MASDSGADPVIVLNKADFVPDAARLAADVQALAPAVRVHVVTCTDPASLDVLRAYLGIGKTAALLGSSGSANPRSSIGCGRYDLLATREVRVTDSRGRHTSTSRQLVRLPGGGVLIDTPGMREIQLWDTAEPVSGSFADVAVLAESCRFRDCHHQTEPGCAVREAVERGELPAYRLESYGKLLAEQAHQERQQDQRAQLDEKRRNKAASRALTKRLKEKDY